MLSVQCLDLLQINQPPIQERRLHHLLAAALALAMCTTAALADTHYVNAANQNARAPYTTPKTAAQGIADALGVTFEELVDGTDHEAN